MFKYFKQITKKTNLQSQNNQILYTHCYINFGIPDKNGIHRKIFVLNMNINA